MEIAISKEQYEDMVANNSKDAELYAEDEFGGGYALKSVLEREHGLRTALHRERDNVKDARRKAAQQSGNPEELDQLRKHAEELADEKADFQTQLTQMQETLASLTGSLSKERAQSAIKDSVAASKGTPGLAAFLQQRVRVDNATGGVQPVDPDTGAAILDAEGKPLTLQHYVAALREQALAGDDSLAGMFLGSQASGGSAELGGGRTGVSNVQNFSQLRRSRMTPAEKTRHVQEFGHDSLMSIPW